MLIITRIKVVPLLTAMVSIFLIAQLQEMELYLMKNNGRLDKLCKVAQADKMQQNQILAVNNNQVDNQ